MTQSTPIPPGLSAEFHGPIMELLADTFLTTDELGARWRQTPQALRNSRRAARGIPYIKLPPSGHVRYRLSDVVRAELTGIRGPVTPEVVRLALAGLPGLTPQLRDTVQRRIENIIASEPRG